MVVKHAFQAIAWYLAINLMAVLPVLGLAWIWSTIAGQGCCDHAPAPLNILGAAWGGLALLAILLPRRSRTDAVWLYAIAAIAWVRVVLLYVSAVGNHADGPLKLIGLLLLIAYIAAPTGILHRFIRFSPR